MNVHELAVATKNKLLKDGWRRGTGLRWENSPLCVGHAALAASSLPREMLYDIIEQPPEIKELFERLMAHSDFSTIWIWNDYLARENFIDYKSGLIDPAGLDRKEKEIMAALDRVIKETAPAPDVSFIEENAPHLERQEQDAVAV